MTDWDDRRPTMLEQLELRQDEVLERLDQLDRQIEHLLSHLGTRAPSPESSPNGPATAPATLVPTVQ